LLQGEASMSDDVAEDDPAGMEACRREEAIRDLNILIFCRNIEYIPLCNSHFKRQQTHERALFSAFAATRQDALARHGGAKPILVLTHTNAGVAALGGRLEKAGVRLGLFRAATLDGFAIRLIWTFPRRAGHDPRILNGSRPNYEVIRERAEAPGRSGMISKSRARVAATYQRRSRCLASRNSSSSLRAAARS
jgi:hypothetical protein